ncbi:hypothetical protein [Mucilaginibacter ginkgonis]|uniref:Uncharacterized protein n=1 Tax=Mucilaginibacter ginkgonis TaxID=2682091 RepID=A0A6I4I1X8_9SPHI|nr:hypothetical protein [Mucilaginibacter ginkgonis]QQL50821.1 hypothetical protein GO620_005010 [Mucilaginibacter ginkgonis]
MKFLFVLLVFAPVYVFGQKLHVRDRPGNALTGSQFAASISDTAISLEQREKAIFKEIKRGNIPQFYRQLVKVTDTATFNGKLNSIEYYVAPDYLAIGTDSDFFYCPMTPALAQRVANKLKCMLPTRKMVNTIYIQSQVKLSPLPIPPSPAMNTVPVFIKHNNMLTAQRDSSGSRFALGSLIGGNKKDVIISNRIYNDTSTFHVVIYGWHRISNGKAIQPLYARHLNTWADYSHGIRLIQKKVWVNGKKTTVDKVLKSKELSTLLSDEGPIEKPFYPTHVD